jgi:hypothetical protein
MKEKFDSYSFDVDKPDAIPLLEKYGVIAYPRMIILNSAGYLVDKIENIPQTFQQFNHLMDSLALSKNYRPGISNDLSLAYPKFYTEFFESRLKNRPDSTVVDDYLSHQADLYSELNWNILTFCNYNDKYTNYILDHQSKYRELYGIEVSFKIYEIYRRLRDKYIVMKDSVHFNQFAAKLLADPSSPQYQNTLSVYYTRQLYFLAQTGMDWPKFIAVAKDYINQFGTKDNPTICSYIFDSNCNDNFVLRFALDLMPSVLSQMPYSAYYILNGAFLFKLGKKTDAENWFNKAIDAAPNVTNRELYEKRIESIKSRG